MERISYGLVVAVVVFAGFPALARAGPVFNGPYPNPNALQQPNGQPYLVDAFDASADDPQSWNNSLGTPAQAIQDCMNAQLTNAGQQANWPLPVQGAAFPDLSFTANTQANPNNYSAYADANLCGATLDLTTTNWPAGEHWLQVVYTNYSVDSVPAGSTVEDPNGHGFLACC